MRRQELVLFWIAINAAIWLLSRMLPVVGVSSKVLILCGLATAATLVYWSRKWRRLLRYIRKLEDYAASVPSTSEIQGGLPEELTMLYGALGRTSEHVRLIIEQANLELARRETILAGMAEGVLAVDNSLNVTFCNEAFANAFRTRLPVPEGRPFFEIVREPALRDILSDVTERGNAVRHRMHLPSAQGRWFEIHALPLGNAPCSGAIAVLHDVTDIQRQEQSRKDFVANVSHELRTPLTAIRGYAETLLDGGLEDTLHSRKFVEIIQAHAIRLNNIAADLLVLSELDSQAPTAPPAPVPVHEVIEAALHTVEPGAVTSNISFHLAYCRNCTVLGNRLRLEQVMINLLDNAVKFNRTGGSVTIGCAHDDAEVNVTITDTGSGIAKEDLKRIFERFYRVDKARSRHAGGTGLGLSIVKESVERMGGSVSVESQLGQGCRFTLRLPAA